MEHDAPYRQAANVLTDFLPIEATERYATVRKRTIRIGEHRDNQIAQETWRVKSLKRMTTSA